MDDESEVCPFPLSDVGVPPFVLGEIIASIDTAFRLPVGRSVGIAARPSPGELHVRSTWQRARARGVRGINSVHTRCTYEIAGTGEQRQYVAPVTGGVPHRQQNRHVALLCRCECLGPQGYQSTGFSRCRRRYGEVSSANRFTRSTASPPLS